jgi:3-oxoadipate enol-lactonase
MAGASVGGMNVRARASSAEDRATARSRHSTTVQREQAAEEEHLVELAYTRHDGGAEGTILLFHSLALDRTVWDGLIPHLQERFEVVAVDLPGHGGSPALEQTTIESMADATVPLVREAAPGGAIVLGLSLGGCVAQALAIRHPELVRGLGLLDTTCWYGDTAQADWEGRAQKAATEGFDSLAGFQLARWFSPGFGEAQPEIGRRLLAVFRSNDVDSYVATCRAMGAMDLRDELPNISVPVSILVGEHDPATPVAAAELMRQLLPHAGMHVLPHCSHLSAVEQPAAIARILAADLLARIDDEGSNS